MLLEVDVEKKLPGFQCRYTFTLDRRRSGVFGPSGSGKSTLMHMLSGLLHPDSGHIRLNGRTLFDSSAGINLSPDKRKVGVVFQHALLFPHMNVAKNLFYGMTRLEKKEREIVPEELIKALQLEHLLDRRIQSLSGGERQRVALGRTLLACPHLVLLDEPLTGLDRDLKYKIIPHLQRVFDRFFIPMLFISHSLEELRLLTEHTLVIAKGGVEGQLATEELARRQLGKNGHGYNNLLQLNKPKDLGDLIEYSWGELKLMLVKTSIQAPGRFALNGRDILLFKKHPEATSARNMLDCVVRRTYETDWLVGVELDCRGQPFIAEIVPQSIEELDIKVGSEVVAVFKASAFQRLC